MFASESTKELVGFREKETSTREHPSAHDQNDFLLDTNGFTEIFKDFDFYLRLISPENESQKTCSNE